MIRHSLSTYNEWHKTGIQENTDDGQESILVLRRTLPRYNQTKLESHDKSLRAQSHITITRSRTRLPLRKSDRDKSERTQKAQ